VGIVILTLMRPCLRRVPEPPPVMGRLPAFTFVDEAGRSFGPERLRGAVWILHFFYIGCGAECAGPLRSLGEIRRSYADLKLDGIRVLSLSVDPARDTPEALRAFAAAGGPDPERWLLATGEAGDIEAFARDLFGPGPAAESGTAAQGTAAGAPALAWLARTGRLVLVDPDGGVRGFYATDPTGIDEVYNRAQRVREVYRRR
jgi:protein SCO1/2